MTLWFYQSRACNCIKGLRELSYIAKILNKLCLVAFFGHCNSFGWSWCLRITLLYKISNSLLWVLEYWWSFEELVYVNSLLSHTLKSIEERIDGWMRHSRIFLWCRHEVPIKFLVCSIFKSSNFSSWLGLFFNFLLYWFWIAGKTVQCRGPHFPLTYHYKGSIF